MRSGLYAMRQISMRKPVVDINIIIITIYVFLMHFPGYETKHKYYFCLPHGDTFIKT
jgi:hypothetical protein